MEKKSLKAAFVPTFLQKIPLHPFYLLCLIGVIAIGISSFKSSSTSTVANIGVIDLESVIVQSNSGKRLQEKLSAFQEQAKAEGEALSNEARDIRQRLTDGANSLSQDKLNELQKQLEDKTIIIRRFQDDKQREGQKMQNEGLREIEKEVEPVLKELVKQQGVDLILNNVPGQVIFASESIDLTQALIALMNR